MLLVVVVLKTIKYNEQIVYGNVLPGVAFQKGSLEFLIYFECLHFLVESVVTAPRKCVVSRLFQVIIWL